jgi:putative tricarboxylic transport membrane protein
MKKRGLYVALFWVALGMFVSIYAYAKLSIGRLSAPSPGFMPFLLGLLFSLLAVFALIGILRQQGQQNQPKRGKTDQPETVYKKVILVVVALFAYAILLEPLGFVLTTFLTMTLLFRSAGFTRWITAATYSGSVVLITYFLFTYLGVRFPPGILRPLGLY